jgi:hypothetical protein
VLQAWAGVTAGASGHFSVSVNDSLLLGSSEAEKNLAQEAAALLALPWKLLPPYRDTPELLSEKAALELQVIGAMAERLLRAGETRIVFTSREALPAPFDANSQRWELHRLGKGDAVAFIERSLAAGESSGAPGAGAGAAALAARREEIEALVDAVQGHARTLALLASELKPPRPGSSAARTPWRALSPPTPRRRRLWRRRWIRHQGRPWCGPAVAPTVGRIQPTRPPGIP